MALINLSKTKFFKLHKLPRVLEANSFYYIFVRDNLTNTEYVNQYITDNRGKAKNLGNVEMINNIIDERITELGESNTITSYRSDYDAPSLYVYSGFLFNGVAIVKRCKDNIEEFAQGVTDLETDWTNRLTLTYV